MDFVQKNVNRALDVVRDPTLKGEVAKKKKRDKLHAIYEDAFDKEEFSRRTLGKDWSRFNEDQRKRFVELYQKLLENVYSDKILSYEYKDEKVMFDREIIHSPNFAEVYTRVITPSKVIPVSYRLIQKGGRWKIYDVTIENVSLIQNYKTQFRELLAKNTPDQFLNILEEKVKGK
ncbi:MAG: ABC transporter substrate-binding protein [Syntrophales bacterium]|nr:ABC transporter substrate-binding protein [Syntrophales bacterium]